MDEGPVPAGGSSAITFPLMRRRPHVALVWDHSWQQFRVQVVGCLAPAGATEFHDDHPSARECLISMGERLRLPVIDLTADRLART